jgi:hypothetical protein
MAKDVKVFVQNCLHCVATVPVNAPLDFIKAQKLMEVEKMSKAMTEILRTGGGESHA